MSTPERFLVAMIVIYAVPFLIWRIGRTEYFAPLVVVQIMSGILLGPGILGAAFPDYYSLVFTADVVHELNGIASWAVMLFVFIAGIELDLSRAWAQRTESAITAGLALGVPLVLGCGVGAMMLGDQGWVGAAARNWQFLLAIGMACSVTALPILVLFLERLEILRQTLGQRILCFASMDDLAIWGVLALILMDWTRIGMQVLFLAIFLITGIAVRRLMRWLPERDRWFVAPVWVLVCGLGADWAGLHFMVGAFLSGAVLDSRWFDQERMDLLRHHVLLILMPVFFLSTGLRTQWETGSGQIVLVAGSLLAAAVVGKLAGVHLAGRILRWRTGEASLIGWLLQTKALIMIIFANILLDRHVITSDTFTALLLMAVASTMLTIPVATPMLARLKRDEPAPEVPATLSESENLDAATPGRP